MRQRTTWIRPHMRALSGNDIARGAASVGAHVQVQLPTMTEPANNMVQRCRYDFRRSCCLRCRNDDAALRPGISVGFRGYTGWAGGLRLWIAMVATLGLGPILYVPTPRHRGELHEGLPQTYPSLLRIGYSSALHVCPYAAMSAPLHCRPDSPTHDCCLRSSACRRMAVRLPIGSHGVRYH